MAFDEYDNYEQSERVQKWLRENGMSIAVGIAIGLVGIFGWQQWQQHQIRDESDASQLYKGIQVALASGKLDQAGQLTEQMIKDHAKSPYAVFAVSDRAVQQVKDKQLDKAEASLSWAVAHAEQPPLKALSQLRLAKLELARDQGTTALATLDQMAAGSFPALAQELRGDVLVKLGRPDEARKAYQAAIAALDDGAQQRAALQMKLDDLAVAGKQGA